MNAIAHFGERLACEYLQRQFSWKIIKNNVRCPYGEVDIVSSADENTVIFIEVKTWRSYLICDLQYAVDLEKQRRLTLAAEHFLETYPQYASKLCRFDVVFISLNPVAIFHLPDVFDRWEEQQE